MTTGPTQELTTGAIQELLGTLPLIDRFCTVDELHAFIDRLAADRSDVCRLRRIGTSRLGEPLRLLSVGHGRRNALVVGGPHPNEPVGLLTVQHLAQLVADTPALRDGADLTWHFIPCLDPDGTRLNEGWLDGPYTLRHYHTEFYRPGFADQPEWTFPVTDDAAWFDRMLPETQALARVIDELRPDFQYSLHNADFGGVFFILSRPLPGVADDLAAIAAAHDVLLSRGSVDTLGWTESGPGVYLMPSAGELTAAAARHGTPPDSGLSSSHYAQPHGTTTLITEVPLWRDARANDLTPAGRHGDVLREAARQLGADRQELRGLLEQAKPYLVVPTPMRAALAGHLQQSADLALAYGAMAGAGQERDATVADAFAARCIVHMLRLRGAGLLNRRLGLECAAGNQPPAVRSALARTRRLFEDWCADAERELTAEVHPLRDLVAVQMGAALAVLRRLGSRHEKDVQRP
ncbi:M14 family zinc carboxypeptidase [Streptomyces lomondensis]|uniref:Zinc carboxypeptidase n=1 Tax=Streptomyces lomondensis TaxID=68229 RepID=A0ABQ2XUZ8_9ACTN|nr:M14 family zinc carboxypeptidase [Streptomyces lomondensis]MCF0082709.1 dehydrogenase [Streptomyces lomondensis]GGX32269.1 zinc carboxypeptidase [Streptomyces lomondensis]